jgi:hypothetical protein
MDTARRASLVLGAVDGVILVLGLVAGLVVARQGAGAVWHAALSGGLVELVGMTAASRLSGKSLAQAWACGAATAAAAIVPALPFLVAAGAAATACSLGLVVLEAAAIAWLRPERGRAAVVQTFGWLALAGVVSALGGLT